MVFNNYMKAIKAELQPEKIIKCKHTLVYLMRERFPINKDRTI